MPGGIHPPPEVIASWPPPNYVDPPTRGASLVVMEIVLTVACYLIVALRVWTRGFLVKSFGWDDAVIIFNLLPLTAMAIALILAITKCGWNLHIWDVPLETLYKARKLSLIIQFTYLVTTVTTKVSILLFYRRLTSRVSTPFLWIIYSTIAFVCSVCVAGMITLLVGCRPLNAYWLQSNPTWLEENQGKFYCYDEAVYIIFIAVFSMVTDFVVCLLPLAFFVKLNMPLRQKIALGCIFGVGFFLCICGILRMFKIIRTYYGTYDITWSAVPVWYWTGIEAHLAVIVASLPALHHFFRRALDDSAIASKLKSFKNRRYGSGYGSGYDRTQSAGNSEYNDRSGNRSVKHPKGSIHVVHEVRLEELMRDKEPDQGFGINGDRKPWSHGESIARKDARAWLDEDTSGEESVHNFRIH